jgi:hypothetical protein
VRRRRKGGESSTLTCVLTARQLAWSAGVDSGIRRPDGTKSATAPGDSRRRSDGRRQGVGSRWCGVVGEGRDGEGEGFVARESVNPLLVSCYDVC